METWSIRLTHGTIPFCGPWQPGRWPHAQTWKRNPSDPLWWSDEDHRTGWVWKVEHIVKVRSELQKLLIPIVQWLLVVSVMSQCMQLNVYYSLTKCIHQTHNSTYTSHRNTELSLALCATRVHLYVATCMYELSTEEISCLPYGYRLSHGARVTLPCSLCCPQRSCTGSGCCPTLSHAVCFSSTETWQIVLRPGVLRPGVPRPLTGDGNTVFRWFGTRCIHILSQ